MRNYFNYKLQSDLKYFGVNLKKKQKYIRSYIYIYLVWPKDRKISRKRYPPTALKSGLISGQIPSNGFAQRQEKRP